MKIYVQNDGHSIDVSQVWEEVRSSIVPAIIFIISSAIVTQIAGLFFLLPGIYIAIVTSIGFPIIVFEHSSFGQTWSRCFQLITNKWWSTFGLISIMMLIGFIFYLNSQIPSLLISGIISGLLKSGVPIIFWTILSSLLTFLSVLLIAGLYYTALGFQYTNLVERQEGRGLQSAIDSIGTSPTQPRASDEGSF